MNSNFLCSECASCYRERWELTSHIKNIHDTRVFKCPICDENIVGQGKFDVHKKKHKTKACKVCWKLIPLNSFSTHKAKCEGKTHLCDMCEYETPRKELLKKHIIGIQKPKINHCPHCMKLFKSSDLGKHVKIHVAVKNVPCPLCRKKFSSQKKTIETDCSQ